MNNFKYGKSSKSELEMADTRLRQVFNKSLELGRIDITIIETIRSREKQNKYFREGKSKVEWPDGKHNIKTISEKSKAIDAGPYIDGLSDNFNHCCFLAGVILAVARSLEVNIKWGGNWDMDGEPVTDQDFQDLYHYELIGE